VNKHRTNSGGFIFNLTEKDLEYKARKIFNNCNYTEIVTKELCLKK